jgi:hypothetical protein
VLASSTEQSHVARRPSTEPRIPTFSDLKTMEDLNDMLQRIADVKEQHSRPVARPD